MSSARTATELGLAPVAPRRAFEEILEQLERAISAGSLGAGDRLPPERELAATFGVSRTSVRDALRVLEALGIVATRRGGDHGTVLLQQPGNGFATILRLLVVLGHVTGPELIEFRVMLETAGARALAASLEPAVMQELERLLEAMKSELDQPESFHRHDADFHVTIARSTGNRLIDLIEGATDGALRQMILDVAAVAGDKVGVRRELAREHARILAAIGSGDGERASALLAEHIRIWATRVARAAS